MTSAPPGARTSSLRTWDTAGARHQQNAARGPSDVGDRRTNYAPWVRRRERSSVTAAGDTAARIGHRVRAVRERTGPRRSSGGTSAVELSGPGRKPRRRLPAGPPAAAAARHGGRAIYAARGSARRRRSADGGPPDRNRVSAAGARHEGAPWARARGDGRSGERLRVTAQARTRCTTLFRPQYLQCG